LKARTAKFGFLALALVLTAVMFLWPSKQEERLSLSANMEVSEDALDISPTEMGGMTSTVMESPHFTGEDEKGRRWSMKAKQAIQERAGVLETLNLNDVHGFSTLQNGEEIKFKAGYGTVQNENGTISLTGGVNISGYGYTLKTSEISGNMQDLHLKSKETVHITSPQGFIEAGQFEMRGEKGNLIFDKGVQVRFYSNQSVIKTSEGAL
jgi:hypothetical protein